MFDSMKPPSADDNDHDQTYGRKDDYKSVENNELRRLLEKTDAKKGEVGPAGRPIVRRESSGPHQSSGQDAMQSLSHSNPIRVYVERDGEAISYDIALTAPYVDDRPPMVEPRDQMANDGIAAHQISAFLHEWLQEQLIVETVAIDFIGSHYTIAILATSLSRQIMMDLQMSIDQIRSCFRMPGPVITVLGPNQRDSLLLVRAGEWAKWTQDKDEFRI